MIEVIDKTVRVDLRCDGLFHPTGIKEDLQDIYAAYQLVQKTPEIETVIVIQGHSNSIVAEEWASQHTSQVFASELARHIQNFRNLLDSVRHDRVPWIYTFSGDCFNEYWELALACHSRMCFDRTSQVGFPVIKYGGLPLGENLRKESNSSPRYSFWKKNNTAKVEQAKERGEVLFVAEDFSWKKLIGSINLGKLKFEKPQVDVSQRESRSERKKLTRALENPDANMAASDRWQLVDSLKDEHEEDVFGIKINRLASSFLLSSYYKKYIYSTYNRQRVEEFEGANLDVVYIDVDDLLPPVSCLYRLLSVNVRICFFSSSVASFSTKLERLYVKLEKAYSTAEIKKLWDSLISWVVVESSTVRGVILKWTFEETLRVCLADMNQYSFQRLEGNLFDAAAGYLEICDSSQKDDLPEEINFLINALSDGVIKTSSIGGSRVPVSVWLRSKMLEELIELAGKMGRTLDSLLEDLDDLGWEFIGSHERWNRFLNTRYANWATLDHSDDFIANYGPEQRIWDVGTWKHARVLVKSVGENLRWSKTHLNNHLVTFVGLLARKVLELGWVDSEKAANDIYSQSFGYPADHSMPLAFLQERGYKRIDAYAKVFWEDLRSP